MHLELIYQRVLCIAMNIFTANEIAYFAFMCIMHCVNYLSYNHTYFLTYDISRGIGIQLIILILFGSTFYLFQFPLTSNPGRLTASTSWLYLLLSWSKYVYVLFYLYNVPALCHPLTPVIQYKTSWRLSRAGGPRLSPPHLTS